jgi:26S proteasome regulatory subunit N6
LCSLYLELKLYANVLTMVLPLVKELKKLDDKIQLVEVQLMESKAFFYLSNFPKSRCG